MSTPSLLLAISCIIGAGSIAIVAIAIRKRLWLEGLAAVMLAGIVLALLIPSFLMQSRSSSQPAAQAAADSEAQANASAEAQAATRRATTSLDDAVAQGLVEITTAGAGLDSVELTLASRQPGSLTVAIPAGTIFAATAGGVQNMVVREEQMVVLEGADAEVALTVPAACINMTRNTPVTANQFIMGGPAKGDLARLVALPTFKDRPFRVQQFAIWTVTDNPTLDEYAGIGSYGLGTGPSREEMQLVRALFAEAGIATNKYWALR